MQFTDSISTKYRWPNKTVPYQLSMNHTSEQRNHIELALKTIESVACVKFIRRSNETDYIEITVSLLIVLHLSAQYNKNCCFFVGQR